MKESSESTTDDAELGSTALLCHICGATEDVSMYEYDFVGMEPTCRMHYEEHRQELAQELEEWERDELEEDF